MWKTVWQFLRKLNTELLFDPAIPLLNVYPKEMKAVSKIYLYSMFITVLFTIVKTWKQLSVLSTNEWIKKMWPIHTMKYLLFSL